MINKIAGFRAKLVSNSVTVIQLEGFASIQKADLFKIPVQCTARCIHAEKQVISGRTCDCSECGVQKLKKRASGNHEDIITQLLEHYFTANLPVN